MDDYDPLAYDVYVRREDAEAFIEKVRDEEPELADVMRVEPPTLVMIDRLGQALVRREPFRAAWVFPRHAPDKRRSVILAVSTVAIVAIAVVVIVALLAVVYILPRGGRRRP